MEKELVGVALYFYTRTEKRGLPLEASKALVNSLHGRTPPDVALSLLRKTKEFVSFWIEDDSLSQIYKRYFNYLLKKESLLLGECFAPFVLVNCYESFQDVLLTEARRKEAFGFLKSFFGKLVIEELLKVPDREEFFESLVQKVDLKAPHNFYVATHVAYLANPNYYAPITPAAGRSIDIHSPGSYMRFMDYIRGERIKPLEAYATLHLLYEDVPSKKRGLEALLGIDRERELLIEASELWNSGRFYEAHEILEEVWKLQQSEEAKDCYQGIIRFALVLHYLTTGESGRAMRVLRKALPQMEGCDVKVRVNVKELSLSALDIMNKLKSKEAVDSFPVLKVL
ncbi:DUF309 domain-containing protein [Hydrogenivirga sp.]